MRNAGSSLTQMYSRPRGPCLDYKIKTLKYQIYYQFIDMDNRDAIGTCRVCLKEGKDYLPLNSGDPSFKIKLHICIPNMDLDVVNVSVLCTICAFEVDTSYNLHNKCRNTEDKLQDYLMQNHLTSIENLQWISLFDQVSSENKMLAPFRWTESSVVDSLEVKLEEKACNKLDSDSDNDSLKLGNYKLRFPSLKKISSKVKEDKSKCDISTESIQFVCFCEKKYKTQTLYKKHMKEHEEHQCDECGKVFKDGNTFKAHLKTHSTTLNFLCNICGMSFNLRWKLKSHMRKHADEKSKNKYMFDDNNLMDEIFSCEICQRHFPKRKYLYKHLKIHGTKKFECDICKKHFTTSGDLGKHRRVHTGEKPYECKICGMRFRLAVLLTRHIRSHTGEKPYVCETCGKRFNQRYNLKSHIRIHTGEKPYECDTCAKRFSHKVTLDSHIVRVHAGGEVFKCEICFKCFHNNTALSNHRCKHKTEINKSDIT